METQLGRLASLNVCSPATQEKRFVSAQVSQPTDTVYFLECPTFLGVDLTHFKMTSDSG